MEWRDTTERGGVRVGTGLDEVLDHPSLSRRVPVAGARATDCCGVQGLRPAPISRPDVGAGLDQSASEHRVVREGGRMQCGIARIDLRAAAFEEELSGPTDARSTQLRRRRQRLFRDGSVARTDSAHDRDQVWIGGHTER